MTRLVWGAVGERRYEQGVDRGVLYPTAGPGVAWNGLTAVTDAPIDTDAVERYYDGQKFRQTGRPGSFAATLEAFSYPKEFESYDGFSGLVTRQRRKSFGFTYRTMLNERDYKIHLVYNALASPSSLDHESIDDEMGTALYSWGISTTPIPITGANASAHLIIDSSLASPLTLKAFEDLIYGGSSQPPRLPLPDEVIEMFESLMVLRITDHGDGTWTADGPDSVVVMLDATTFEISWPSAVYIDTYLYQVSSL